mmetsp:Transcript_26631/g.61165  ORF Transcript_26631/g.61165 Transcript_26631/m.61165 type:complete len:100 (-) Transcript_26631:346-645(-)
MCIDQSSIFFQLILHNGLERSTALRKTKKNKKQPMSGRKLLKIHMHECKTNNLRSTFHYQFDSAIEPPAYPPDQPSRRALDWHRYHCCCCWNHPMMVID